MPKPVYVGNFGYCWKLTPVEWREVCESGARGDGYDLSAYRELKGFPRFIVRGDDTDRRSSTRADILYYEPLDWENSDFAEVLAEMD